MTDKESKVRTSWSAIKFRRLPFLVADSLPNAGWDSHTVENKIMIRLA